MKGSQVTSLVEKQQTIGWDNFLFGRISPEWLRVHSTIVPSKENYKSKRWVSALIKKLVETAWDMWEHRNGIMHSAAHPWRQHERMALAVEIRRQYRLGTQTLLPKDRYYLSGRLEDVLNLPDDQQQHWMQTLLAARADYIHHQEAAQDVAPPPDIIRMRVGFAGWLHGRL